MSGWRATLRRLEWPILWALVVVAFVLGMVGFSTTGESGYSVTDRVYRTLQLFVLGGNFEGRLGWELEVARFLAPGVMAYTASQALLVLFREQLRLLRLRFTRGHVIVCGLGRLGLKVTAAFLHRGERVVVIEDEGMDEWIGMAEEMGATVLLGDATTELMLRQARMEFARLIVVVCGSDGVNVETAMRAYTLKVEAGHVGPPLECHVHIVEEDLCALFREHRVFKDTGDRFRVLLFDIYESSARLLFREYPLDRERIGPEDGRTVHLIVVGFGQMGESVLLQAARTGHFANGRRLRVTVIDQDPAVRQRRLMRRYSQLEKVCDVEFRAMEADSAEAFAAVREIASQQDALVSVAVCFDDDARGLSIALALLPGVRPFGVPILLRMATDGGLTALLDAGIADSRFGGLLRPFPLIGLAADGEALIHREMDAGAMAAHAHFVENRRNGAHDPADPSLLPWDHLDEDLKDSNRQQADHIAVKLRAFGFTVVKGSGPAPEFTAEEVECLAKMEHARWNAGRFLSGWRFAPGKKNVELKTSPRLLPWADLPEDIRAYDREVVRNIPRIVALGGGQISRTGG